MRVLLDTHVILWWYFDSGRLKKEHFRIIADGSNEVYVSAAAIWEIEVKRRNGKIDCPVDMMERIRKDGFLILPITADHLVHFLRGGRIIRMQIGMILFCFLPVCFFYLVLCCVP